MKPLVGALFASLLGCSAAVAQQTGGSIGGRVLDPQGAAVPGVTITAESPLTGFTRATATDGQGLYRLTTLPAGAYDVKMELQGFSTVLNEAVQVYVSQMTTLDVGLKVAAVAETINVTGTRTFVDATSSAVGGIVDPDWIRRLPLNGRQFANLAATVPGVGLGFHADPTKGTNYAPQINGGAGRNVNYQIDGGDNNDDTVGGLLQQFPLEAIREFNFITQRFKAEYGRSNGGVMNVVTKSGTNQYEGSFFELFRDKSMNALTETEVLGGRAAGRDPAKGDYRRNQFGGGVGGPLVRDRVHFFAAVERTQQDTTQTVNTRGLFTALDGAYPLRYRENLVTAKVAASISSTQYLTVRYGYNDNSFPFGAGPVATPDNWGDATNTFNSINVNHHWMLGGSRLNELVFQYADFSDRIGARSSAPNLVFPIGVMTGGNLNTPQSTEQRKYQLRDDFSWHVTGRGGLGHDFKSGINVIFEPHLFITNQAGKGVVSYTMLDNTLNGRVQRVTQADGDGAGNIPNTQLGLYFQDDWRVSDRLTVNAGVRYDLVTGFAFDQSLNPNFAVVQAAARAGLLGGIAGLETFGLEPRSDRNDIQPRVGAVYDARGNGKDIIRGGSGVYTDFGYTASNVLLAALDSSGTRFGNVFDTGIVAGGLRNPDGSFYVAGQPLTNLASQNTVGTGSFPLLGFWVDPRLQQPYQIQTNAGWSHELTPGTVVSVDVINSIGRNLNFKPRVNQLIPGTRTRRVSTLLSRPLSPNNSSNRPVLSRGASRYNALIVSGQRRLSKGVDFSASYMLSSAVSNIGAASDETNTANIQNPDDPFDNPVQMGPNLATDARHRINLSAVIALPYGMQVAPFFLYRSALPIFLVDGRDLNRDGDAFDIPSRAFGAGRFDVATGKGTVDDIGACARVNCGRGWPQSQLNLRVSRVFRLGGRLNIEAIGEVFNLFNATNPSNIVSGASVNRRVFLTSGAPDPTLLQPASFSGDNQRPEQRVGQIGFRLSF